jgi:hypothetical protein
MNDKTGGSRGALRAAALAAVTASALLATACGSSDPPAASAPAYAQVLALVQCMRGHGAPGFPDPTASGGYNLSANGTLTGAGGSADISSSQVQAAYGDCRHVLPGGPTIAQLEAKLQQGQQQQAQALPLLVKYSQCMRGHGVPDFPGPGQGAVPAGGLPDVNSPQYAAAAAACRHLLPPGAQVSVSTSRSLSAS